VLFLVDDMGWRDLACQGSLFYETPNIDRLAAQGMTFTDAYATAPICSPSRASIQTGKSPARLRITDWIPGHRFPHAKLAPPSFRHQLPLEEVTIAEALRDAGYTTLHVGKWHLGGQGYWPGDQGYDVNVAGHTKGAPGSYFHPYAKVTADTDWSVENLPLTGAEGEYLTDRLTDEASAWIERSRDGPFFLHMSYYTVHSPYEGKPELVERYRAKKQSLPPDAPQSHAVFAAMVQSLDESVGRILSKLEQLDLARDTIVIFTSDNGGVHDISSNAPLRAGKGHLYEGGLRVPFFVRWPGVVAAGSESREPIWGADLVPTLLEAAGAADQGTTPGELDGLSLVDLLSGRASRLGREGLFWHYPHYHTPRRPPSGAVRSGDYKLIEFYETGRVELYDLARDIGEQHDLSESRPRESRELRVMLHAWLEGLGAHMPVPNPEYDAQHPWRGAYNGWDDPGLGE